MDNSFTTKDNNYTFRGSYKVTYSTQQDDIVSKCNECNAVFNGIGKCPLCHRSNSRNIYKNGSYY